VRGELAPRGAGVGGLGGDSGECPTKREDKCRASLFSLCSTAWAAGVLYVFVPGVCLAAYSSHKRSPLVARSRTSGIIQENHTLYDAFFRSGTKIQRICRQG
jgi:hypothetical protein